MFPCPHLVGITATHLGISQNQWLPKDISGFVDICGGDLQSESFSACYYVKQWSPFPSLQTFLSNLHIPLYRLQLSELFGLSANILTVTAETSCSFFSPSFPFSSECCPAGKHLRDRRSVTSCSSSCKLLLLLLQTSHATSFSYATQCSHPKKSTFNSCHRQSRAALLTVGTTLWHSTGAQPCLVPVPAREAVGGEEPAQASSDSSHLQQLWPDYRVKAFCHVVFRGLHEFTICHCQGSFPSTLFWFFIPPFECLLQITLFFFFFPLHISLAFFIWDGMHFSPTPDYNLPRSDILPSHSSDYLWQLWLHDQKGRNINKGKGKSSGCQHGTAKVMKLKGLPCCSLSSTSTMHSLDSWDTITVCCSCNCSDVSFCGAGQP